MPIGYGLNAANNRKSNYFEKVDSNRASNISESGDRNAGKGIA
jgi:hypothetical protein